MKIGLGAVQFGLDYGVSNKLGKTQATEVSAILTTAMELGIKVIDTAALYGDSEEVLGQSMPSDSQFDIVTKTPQFTKQPLGEAEALQLENAFHSSLLKLNKVSVYGLLIHRVEDLFIPGSDLLIKQLLKLKQNGLVNKIGVSVYSDTQIDRVLDSFPIDLIQLPINVLDQRLLHSGHLQKLKQAGVQIHARSAFLQGLLLMNIKDVPNYFQGIREQLKSYQRFSIESGLTLLQAALGFVVNIPEIDCVICGVNNQQQLVEIYHAAEIKINPINYAEFAIADESIINPVHWKFKRSNQ